MASSSVRIFIGAVDAEAQRRKDAERMKKQVAVLGMVAALWSVALAGCGQGGKFPRYKVSGKVTYQSQPVEEGTITFEDPTTGQTNEGTLGSGGAYSTELPP